MPAGRVVATAHRLSTLMCVGERPSVASNVVDDRNRLLAGQAILCTVPKHCGSGVRWCKHISGAYVLTIRPFPPLGRPAADRISGPGPTPWPWCSAMPRSRLLCRVPVRERALPVSGPFPDGSPSCVHRPARIVTVGALLQYADRQGRRPRSRFDCDVLGVSRLVTANAFFGGGTLRPPGRPSLGQETFTSSRGCRNGGERQGKRQVLGNPSVAEGARSSRPRGRGRGTRQ